MRLTVMVVVHPQLCRPLHVQCHNDSVVLGTQEVVCCWRATELRSFLFMVQWSEHSSLRARPHTFTHKMEGPAPQQ